MKKLFNIILLASALTACDNRDNDQAQVLPYLDRSLNDTSFVGYHCLADYSPDQIHAGIAVLGDFQSSSDLTELFVASDFFDNINGRENPDELHDFAGETILPVLDLANAPYEGYLEAENPDAIRETAVAMAVASLGKHCYSNMYEEGMGAERLPSKAIVIASPYLCAYAFSDICQLFHSYPPVISAVDRMFISGLDSIKGDGAVLMAPQEELDRGIYRKVWDRLSCGEEKLADYAEVPVLEEGLRASFFALLDSCYVSGRSLRRLMYVPSEVLSHNGLEKLLEEVRTSPGIEMENYRSVLAPDFTFVDAYREAVKATYLLLRERNLFTHRIAYPQVQAFVTVPANDIPLESNDFGGRIALKYKYNHSADANVEVFRTVALSRLYMPEKEFKRIDQLSETVLLNIYRLTGEKY